MDWERLISNLNGGRDRLRGVSRGLTLAAAVIAAAYVLASGLSSYMMTRMMGSALGAFNRMSQREGAAAAISFSGSNNYVPIERAVRDRNLFNSTGEFPDESKAAAQGEKKAETFNINAPCSKPSLNVQLVGTIYLGGGGSVATLQEQGYSESDIYKEGDQVIGSDNAQVVLIERNRVILNNNGVKECLELASAGPKNGGGGFPDVQPAGIPQPDQGTGGGGGGEEAAASGASSEVTFDQSYVHGELGEGYNLIIQKARLVPNTTNNEMNGFKIFAIDQSSILGKIGFQNGDIITQVNDTSLKQPEQGFAVYQALQEEREIRFHVLRRGTTPTMITVRIR